MTILVTGASGHLGSLIVDRLLARGADPQSVLAGVRNPDAADALRDRGVQVVHFDYDEPASVTAALDGVDRVVLVSSPTVGQRARQHGAVIDAAVAAGVKLLAYTSLFKADTSPLPLATEHVETERLIAASGIPAAILRNNWYTENYADTVRQAGDTGTIVAAAGDARVASADRVDYADAAAVVALAEGQAGKVYELAGDVAWTYDELAQAATTLLGHEVTYQAVSEDQLAEQLRAAGLPEGTAGFVAALDAGIAAGGLDSDDHTLAKLIGRPTTPLVEGLRAALA